MNRVKGKVVIVTGAASGIGRGIAELLAEEGAVVFGADIAQAPQTGVTSGPLRPAHLDVRSEESWAQLVEEIVRTVGRIDVLVNNAGVIDYRAIHELDLVGWMQVIDVDQTGVFLGIKAVLPTMLEHGAGSIINISSGWGVVGGSGVAAYQAAKGAVRGLTHNGAIAYAKRGIRMNTIIPGWVHSSLTEKQPEEINRHSIAASALGYGAEPKDIAWGALYLASDESRYVTGSDLVIDGGVLAQ